MWHGGGLTGVTWETKPDGKPGWQMFFLNRGYDVYVSDAVERGRASWARYPEFFKSEPLFRSKKEAWELFRFGPTGSYDPDPANRRTFSDTQFPTEALDQFAKQGVPRWVTNDAPTQAAYDQLVERVCPCVIIVHSQGGNFGFNAALRAHDKIKALVAIEPSGAPDPGKVDVAQLKTVPHLFVFGDHLHDFPSWQNFIKASQRYHAALTGAGVKSDWIDLPTLGIKGNSHMMMMDRNSDQIAELVAKWLEQSRAD
jgi:pimeloyl-ACP methyl ester carboxylesterase